MKTKKYAKFLIFAILVFTVLISGCTKGFEDINKSPDKPEIRNITIPGIFNGIAKDITDEDNTLYAVLFYDRTNQQAVQNVTNVNYLGYVSSLWSKYYPILFDYKKLLKLIDESPEKDSYSNVKYMAMILMASKTLHMLDYYGDIPYTNASMVDEGDSYRKPTYDNQADVYKSVLADLQAAADGIKTGDATQKNIGNSDSFLGNDYAAWIKFANALRLRYAVRLYGKEQSLAAGIITDIINGSKPLPQNQDFAALQKSNFGFWPSKVAPAVTTERNWYTFRENSVSQLRVSTNMWLQMASSNNPSSPGIFDPRAYVWFQTNNADKWVAQEYQTTEGGDPYPNEAVKPAVGADAANLYTSFNVQLVSDQKNFPYLVITEADVYFLKAEIYQKGMGVAKNIGLAKEAYESGVKSSVKFWYAYTAMAGWALTQPTDAQLNTLLAQPSVAYNGSDDAGALKKIITQAWLATLWEPAEAWAIVRRTGLTPTSTLHVPNTINKLPYPSDEETNNTENWRAATGGKSQDDQSKEKVYWMQ